ncbi:hypothetical protein MTO96_002992 [Rhipicephalus appendiculatus]
MSYLEEVSSLSDTSLTWSDEEDLVLTNESADSARADPLLEEEEEEEEEDDGRSRLLAAQTAAASSARGGGGGGRPFLYSWPRTSLPNARSHHRHHRTPHSSSWHEPSLSALASASDSALCGVAAARLKPEDLWKLDCTTLPDLAVPQPYSPTVRSGSATSPLLTYPRPPTSANSDDWEVQMLVEEFEKKVQQEEQSGSRRHSSCEPLSWSRALSRNLTHVAVEPHHKRHATSTSSPFSSQEEGRRRRLRRKHSLRDDRLLRCLAGRQATATDARPKLTRFASLDMPRYHRQQQKQHLLQNHYGEEPGETRGFPESSSSDHLRSSSSSRGAALKRRAFWQSRQRHNTFFAGQATSSAVLGNDKQRLLGAWRSLDEECEPPAEDDHRLLQETSFSNECLWQPSPARSQPTAVLKQQASTTSSVSSSSSFSSHIAGWPSTPCLPTIKEDTGAGGAGGSGRHDLTKALKLSSSGSRSYSENCLADADVGGAYAAVSDETKLIEWRWGDLRLRTRRLRRR